MRDQTRLGCAVLSLAAAAAVIITAWVLVARHDTREASGTSATPGPALPRAVGLATIPGPPGPRLGAVGRPVEPGRAVEAAAAGGTGPRSLLRDPGMLWPCARQAGATSYLAGWGSCAGLPSGRWWLAAAAWEPDGSPGQTTVVPINAADKIASLTQLQLGGAGTMYSATLLTDTATSPPAWAGGWYWAFFGANSIEGGLLVATPLAETVVMDLKLAVKVPSAGAGMWRAVVQLQLYDPAAGRGYELDVNVAQSSTWPDWDPRPDYVHVPPEGSYPWSWLYYYAVLDGASVGLSVTPGETRTLLVPVSALVAKACADNPARFAPPAAGLAGLQLTGAGYARESRDPVRQSSTWSGMDVRVVATTPTPTPTQGPPPTPTPTQGPPPTPTPTATAPPPTPSPTPAPQVWYPPARALTLPLVDGRIPAEQRITFACGSLGCQVLTDGVVRRHPPYGGGELVLRWNPVAVCHGCDRLEGTYLSGGQWVQAASSMLYARGE